MTTTDSTPALSPADLRLRVTSNDWTMLPDALEVAASFGLDRAMVASVLERAQHREVAPQTADVGYLVSRHRLGSVIVVVSHRDEPEGMLAVMAVYVMSDDASAQAYGRAAGARAAGGQGAGRSAPTSLRQFSKRVVEEGYRMERGGSHMKVVSQDGDYVCSAPLTPSDARSWANCWRTFLRAKAKHEAAGAAQRP